MSNKIKKLDNSMLYKELLESVQADRLYKLRNDAKIRAVTTAQSYDEFKDIVAAAHLTPVTKEDKVSKAYTSWNKAL